MIIIVNQENRHEYLSLIEYSFKLRHQIFKEKLNWEVNSHNSQEYDQFDALTSVTYILHTNEKGEVNGCARLIPTNGSNMLKDVFPMLLDGEPAPNSPDIWESTRFAVNVDQLSGAEACLVTARLLDAIAEIGIFYNLHQIISVTEPIMERALKRRGLPTQRIGSIHQVGIGKAVAGYFSPSEKVLEILREKSGFTTSQIINAPWIRKVA